MSDELALEIARTQPVDLHTAERIVEETRRLAIPDDAVRRILVIGGVSAVDMAATARQLELRVNIALAVEPELLRPTPTLSAPFPHKPQNRKERRAENARRRRGAR
jgi:hypothetical protein